MNTKLLLAFLLLPVCAIRWEACMPQLLCGPFQIILQ